MRELTSIFGFLASLQNLEEPITSYLQSSVSTVCYNEAWAVSFGCALEFASLPLLVSVTCLVPIATYICCSGKVQAYERRDK